MYISVERTLVASFILISFVLFNAGASNSAELLSLEPTDKMIHVYGSVSVDGENVAVGTVITAVDPDGTLCGIFEVKEPGYFGLMNIYGDEASTPAVDEGALPGDTIRFFIGGREASVTHKEPVVWTEDGDSIQKNLVAGPQDTSRPVFRELKAISPIRLQLSFNEAISDITGSDKEYYVLEDLAGNPVEIIKAEVNDNPCEIVLITGYMRPGQGYRLTISASISDLWGNTLANEETQTFTINP